MKELPPGLVNPFIGVRPEIVPLGLEQIGWQTLRPVTVIEGKGRSQCWNGNSFLHGCCHNIAPGPMGSVESLPEERIQHQILQLGVLVEGLLDPAEKDAANDAPPLHMRAMPP